LRHFDSTLRHLHTSTRQNIFGFTKVLRDLCKNYSGQLKRHLD